MNTNSPAPDAVRELVEALQKIANPQFNCMPRQYSIAMQAVAEEALAKFWLTTGAKHGSKG